MALSPPPLRTPLFDDLGNMTKSWQIWFSNIYDQQKIAYTPVHLTDAIAPVDSIYYSTTASKLVYKDSGGAVHALY